MVQMRVPTGAMAVQEVPVVPQVVVHKEVPGLQAVESAELVAMEPYGPRLPIVELVVVAEVEQVATMV